MKSAVKSSVKSSTVEPTASEAAMKATAVEAASAKAAAVTATTPEAFGVRTQGSSACVMAIRSVGHTSVDRATARIY